MMTVHEVSRLTGVSIRALQYYDRIGLLHPAGRSGSGYRLYDTHDLEKLQQILLFRELEFPLSDIRRIMDSPDFDRNRALEQQIQLLTMKKEHIENLIGLAEDIRSTGGNKMDFKAFDTEKMEEYARQARETWGKTKEYAEFEAKSAGRTPADQKALGDGLMAILAEFGRMQGKDASDPDVRSQVVKLQSYITEHYYTCTDEILAGLGKMYAAGGEFTENIDAAGGPGTAEFAAEAIMAHCRK